MRGIGRRIWRDIVQYKWLFLVFPVYYLLVKSLFHAFCPLLIVTGFPCPGCGMTRALLTLAQGQFLRAFRLNPSVYPLAAVGVYFAVMRYGLGKRVKGLSYLLGGIAAIMILSYLFRMAAWFPDIPPATFKYDNLINRIFPVYNDLLRHWRVI